MFAGEHTLRRLQEDREKGELALGQRHVLAGGGAEPPRAQIELPAGEAVASPFGVAVWPCRRRSAQDRVDARQPLARAERPGQVVVGAALDAADATHPL